MSWQGYFHYFCNDALTDNCLHKRNIYATMIKDSKVPNPQINCCSFLPSCGKPYE